jgi:predicted DNA-binding antitoxin AbrB/MazE fold protein
VNPPSRPLEPAAKVDSLIPSLHAGERCPARLDSRLIESEERSNPHDPPLVTTDDKDASGAVGSKPGLPQAAEESDMSVIRAVSENEVFRPTEPVDLPESNEVEVELRLVSPSAEKRLGAIYTLLDACFEPGETDVAARHDEHQH